MASSPPVVTVLLVPGAPEAVPQWIPVTGPSIVDCIESFGCSLGALMDFGDAELLHAGLAAVPRAGARWVAMGPSSSAGVLYSVNLHSFVFGASAPAVSMRGPVGIGLYDEEAATLVDPAVHEVAAMPPELFLSGLSIVSEMRKRLGTVYYASRDKVAVPALTLSLPAPRLRPLRWQPPKGLSDVPRRSKGGAASSARDGKSHADHREPVEHPLDVVIEAPDESRAGGDEPL